MKLLDIINVTIDRFPKGYIFTYMDFNQEVSKQDAVIKCLNRLAIAGKISRLSKGKYYKPEISTFGVLEPTQYQLVKDLLKKNNKIIGYITGFVAFNELGLTSQVTNVIQIGRNEIRSAIKRGIYKISFIKQKNNITKENITLLRILDSIRYIKLIPDTTIDKSCQRLTSILRGLNKNELDIILKLSLKYPPGTRALLGGLIDASKMDINTSNLHSTLNPITKYKLSITSATLPTIKYWNIV
jgi:hypothetical protein